MRRTRVVALAAAILATSLAAPAQANSDPNFTGVERIIGNGSVVIERAGRYYMTAVSHRGGTLGDPVSADAPVSRYVGRHAYKSDFKGGAGLDFTLIDMGTTPHSPRVRVSHNYSFRTRAGAFVYGTTQTTPAPTGADWTWGTELCFTAWPKGGTDNVTVRVQCGYADNSVPGANCARTAAVPKCGIRSANGQATENGVAFIQGGDSGGLVWQPRPYGQVRPLGLLSVCGGDSPTLPCKSGLFQPFYGLTKYPFSAAETLAGYPTGPGGRVVTG